MYCVYLIVLCCIWILYCTACAKNDTCNLTSLWYSSFHCRCPGKSSTKDFWLNVVQIWSSDTRCRSSTTASFKFSITFSSHTAFQNALWNFWLFNHEFKWIIFTKLKNTDVHLQQFSHCAYITIPFFRLRFINTVHNLTLQILCSSINVFEVS